MKHSSRGGTRFELLKLAGGGRQSAEVSFCSTKMVSATTGQHQLSEAGACLAHGR